MPLRKPRQSTATEAEKEKPLMHVKTLRVTSAEWRDPEFRRRKLHEAREIARSRALVKIVIELDYARGTELVAKIEGRW